MLIFLEPSRGGSETEKQRHIITYVTVDRPSMMNENVEVKLKSIKVGFDKVSICVKLQNQMFSILH